MSADKQPAGKRCPKCSNYLAICGHDLPFKERVKSVRPDRRWMPTRTPK